MSKPRPWWTLSWSLRRTCHIVITRRNVALSREFVTEASSEVRSEEAPERDLDTRNTRTNYTFTFGPGAEVPRLLLFLCFIISHYTWSRFFYKSVTSILTYKYIHTVDTVYTVSCHPRCCRPLRSGTTVYIRMNIRTHIQSLNVISKSFQSS